MWIIFEVVLTTNQFHVSGFRRKIARILRRISRVQSMALATGSVTSLSVSLIPIGAHKKEKQDNYSPYLYRRI